MEKINSNGIDKKNIIMGNIFRLAGILGVVFFGGCAAIGFANIKEGLDFIVAALFLALAALMLWLYVNGTNRVKLAVIYRSYEARLSADPEKSITKLAEAIGADPQLVKNNIITMIDKGYFPNAHVDIDNNRLILPDETT